MVGLTAEYSRLDHDAPQPFACMYLRGVTCIESAQRAVVVLRFGVLVHLKSAAACTTWIPVVDNDPMRFFDIFSLVLSFLGVYDIVFSLRLLLPRNIVPLVSASLNEAMSLLERAEAIDVPNMSDYRANLAKYAHVCTNQCPSY